MRAVRVGGAHGFLLGLWWFLFHYNVAQGDDRYFQVLSGLPGGRQTFAAIYEATKLTWFQLNGRLGDAMGAAYYHFGPTVFHLILAAHYVLLTAVLWWWVYTASQRSSYPLQPLHRRQADATSWTVWLLVAALPFLICGDSLAMGGAAVFLAAAVWNYLPALMVSLLCLAPSLRHACVAPTSWWWRLTGLVVLLAAMQLQEVVSIAITCVAWALALYLLRPNQKRDWFSALALMVFPVVGLAIKASAPGLWQRQEGGDNPAPLLHRFASVLCDIPVFHLTLLALIVGFTAIVHWVLRARSGRPSKLTMVLAAVSCGAFAVWVWASRSRAWVRSLGGPIVFDRALTLNAVIVIISAAIVLGIVAFYILTLPWGEVGPLPFLTLAAIGGTIVALGILVPYGVGGLYRILYVPVIFMALLVVVLAGTALRWMRESGAARPSSYPIVGLVAVVFAISTQGLFQSANQLAINHGAWANVERQIAQAKAGATREVWIPRQLPCADLAWYFWPSDDRGFQQVRLYYDLPTSVELHAFDPNQTCMR